MGIIEIILISIGVAIDAFAVAICKGLSMKKMSWKKAIIIAFYFGIFQASMPILGYFLGSTFEQLITSIDHWIAFILLGTIGINMIKESFDKNLNEHNENVNFKTMIVLATATSVDAMAVGITFACLRINIIFPITLMGIITFILSIVGVKIGNKFGDKYKSKAEFSGGSLLIILGIKILLEHLYCI